MKHVIICNPAAGSGRAAGRGKAVRQALRRCGLDVELRRSTRPREAVEMARRAAGEAEVVVAAGGDGTVQEVAIGLMKAKAEAALGIVPLGTGNDFAKAVGVPLRWRAAASGLARAETTTVDVGRVRWIANKQKKERCFVNAVGVGFDAQVAQAVQTVTRLRGTAAYLAGVFQTLQRWDGPPVTVRDGAGRLVHEGPLFLATLGNGICSGGGFYLTPTAAPDDGALDLCVIEDLSAARVCRLIPLVLRGRHLAQPDVKMHRVRCATLCSEIGLPLHADGEVLAEHARDIEVEVQPAGLRVRRPVSD